MTDDENLHAQTNEKPTLYVVSGANGSGKSTLTESGLFDKAQVLDPDEIARTISPDNPEGVAAAAGRKAIIERREALAEGRSLAVETTLAGNSTLSLMNDARQAGYNVELHYVGLGDPQLAVDRVSDRVAAGGHGIPEQDIRRRFERSHHNLPEAITRADSATLYDNSARNNPHEVVAELTREAYQFSNDAPRWAKDAAERAANLDHARAQTGTELDRAYARSLEIAKADGIEIEEKSSAKDHDATDTGSKNVRRRDDGHSL